MLFYLKGAQYEGQWLELVEAYESEIRYHPGKANVVTNAFSRKVFLSYITTYPEL